MVDSKILGRDELQRLAERVATARKAAPSRKKEGKP
jgi:hypothetical protein